MFEQLNTRIDALSLDHRRGAAEIVFDAAEMFLAIASIASESPVKAEQLFERAIRRLAKGQPTMAPVLNLLNSVSLAREKTGDDWESFASIVKRLMEQRSDQAEDMERRLSDVPKADTLIVFSNSSTVARLTSAAKRRFGWPRKVYCGEGRPVMEGLVMAQKLIAAGLDVTLFTDAALMSRIVEADGVWVGGDALMREALVNKVGSRALAMLANLQEIPFISMLNADKFLSNGLSPYFHCLTQNPREIGADEADGLNIHNEYYERIPLDLVSLIFTENGASRPEQLVEDIPEKPVSPLFERLVK